MAKPVIVIVDDEPHVLSSIERDLRQHYRDAYRLVKAGGAQEALEATQLLKQRNAQIALFLVDQRMPRMSGTEFLIQARKLFPEAATTEAERAAERKRQHEEEVARKVEAQERRKAAKVHYPQAFTQCVADWRAGDETATTRLAETLQAARDERDAINALCPGTASVTATERSGLRSLQILAVHEAYMAGLGITEEFVWESCEHFCKGRMRSTGVRRQNPANKLFVDALEVNTPKAWQTALEMAQEILSNLYIIYNGRIQGRATLPDCSVSPLVDKRAFMNELCNRVYGETV